MKLERLANAKRFLPSNLNYDSTSPVKKLLMNEEMDPKVQALEMENALLKTNLSKTKRLLEHERDASGARTQELLIETE